MFDKRLPPEPPYPSVIPSIADFTAIAEFEHRLGRSELDINLQDNEQAALLHAPPG